MVGEKGINHEPERQTPVGDFCTGGRNIAAAQSQASQAKIDRALTSKQREELGKTEYEATCALCHGPTGKDDGIYVDQLKQGTVVANLTQLSKKNGGTFPFERVYQIIDGREYVKAHGPRQMPIWGLEYKIRSSRVLSTLNSEEFVRVRILSLIDYIRRFQER